MHADEEVIYEGHPSWRSTFAFYFKGALFAVVAAAVAAVVTLIADSIDWVIVVLVFAVVMALTILVGFVRRMFTVYTITNQRLRIQRGIISRNVQQTRIERVQNVNTDQGVIDRILQVGAVDFAPPERRTPTSASTGSATRRTSSPRSTGRSASTAGSSADSRPTAC